MNKPSYVEALASHKVLETLRPYSPKVVGTPPLGIHVDSSDIDVLCYVSDADAFMETVWAAFSYYADFTIHQKCLGTKPIIARFTIDYWPVEIYAEAIPTEEQRGYRHFQVEERLLHLGGLVFRNAIMDLRRQGLKTEPAFAKALKLEGDPYLALLDLWGKGDVVLRDYLDKNGYCS